MNRDSLIEEAGATMLDVLDALWTSLRPWNAERYCKRAGLPPITLPDDWGDGVTSLRARFDTLDEAQKLAELVALFEGLVATIQAMDSEGFTSARAATEFARRLMLPIVLERLRGRMSGIPLGLYTAVMGLIIADSRLEEHYGDVFVTDRWTKFLTDFRRATDASELPTWLGLLQVLTYFLVPVDWPFRPFFHSSFDHPAVVGLEETLHSASHSFVSFFNKPLAELVHEDYQSFDPPASPWEHRQLVFALVPVRKTADHGDGLYLQLSVPSAVEFEKKTDTADVRLAIGGSIGLLVPYRDSDIGMQPAGAGGLTFDAAYTHLAEPTAAPEDGAIPGGITLTARRYAVSLRILSTDQGLSLRAEDVKLRIGKLPVLDILCPAGLEVTFDAGVLISSEGARLEGGIGGSVEIPLDLHVRAGGDRYELLDVIVRGVRIAVGRHEGNKLRVSLTANASARVFGILTGHVDGAGASLTMSVPEGMTGKLGLADFDWEPVWPQGMGIELKLKMIRGSGYLRYEPEAQRLLGAAEIAIGSWFTISAVGTCTFAPKKSWVIVGAMTGPGGGLAPNGIGVLYGSNRRTDPDAFLDGLRSGVLDAVLFPENVAANASAMAGVLDRLFPIAERGDVIGIMARWTLLGGRLRIDFGGLLENGRDASCYYLIARVRANAPKATSTTIQLEADGVAVWNTARDEFQLRIVLRNSRVFGGELTGEAMVFRGEVDGHRSTFISVGGFHPAYVPPPGIYAPRRIQLTVNRGDHLRIDWSMYFAYTPGGIHFGVQARLVAKFSGFGIRGALGLDMLIGFDGSFDVALSFSVELMLGPRTLAGVGFKGALSGQVPSTQMCGSISVSFLFWTWSSGRKCITLAEEAGGEEFADIAALLDQAIADEKSWDGGGSSELVVSPGNRSGVWISPSRPLEFRQTVAPLARSITRYGSVRLPAPASFEITPDLPAGVSLRTLTDELPPAMYLDLSKEAALSARGFEAMPTGFALDRAFDTGTAIPLDVLPEEIVIDSTNPPVVPKTVGPRHVQLVTAARAFELDSSQIVRPAGATPAIQPERFSVVDTALSPMLRDVSYMEARAATRDSDRLVVPVTEVA